MVAKVMCSSNLTVSQSL